MERSDAFERFARDRRDRRGRQPKSVSGDQKPSHDAMRAWARGFWRAMALAPATWSKRVEDERTKIIIEPFVGLFNLDELAANEIPADIDDRLDADAASIPRMILACASSPASAKRQRRSRVASVCLKLELGRVGAEEMAGKRFPLFKN
jgi:hypothetical protein